MCCVVGNKPVKRLAVLVLALGMWAAAASAEQPTVAQALALIQAGKPAAARELLVPHVQANPEDLAARYWLGRAHLSVGELSEAISIFTGVLSEKPTSVDTRLWLTKALLEDGQTELARQELAPALAARPEDSLALELAQALGLVSAGPEPDLSVPRPVTSKPTEKGWVTLVSGGLSIDPGDVDIYSGNLYDYTFGYAPVDWVMGNGYWEVTSRWTCQPQWSWYGGYNAQGPAAIWNKRQFAGDIVVELYSAFKMGFGVKGRQYKNPNDINITICGDGANLDSGYTFMVGGDYNTVTRIMKGTTVLAETSDTAALLPILEDGFPDSYEFHRKWWGIIARRRGPKLQLYLDNKLVCEAEDPQPLPQGRVAVWTYNNGIIIPRMKIYYEREAQTPGRPAGQEALIVPQSTVATPVVSIQSSSHPAIHNDFEQSLGTWRNRNEREGALLTLVSGGPAGQGHCLQLINQQTGGSFAATIYEDEFDVTQYGKLCFDYKLPSHVLVNLYLTVADQLYEIVFAGRSQPAPCAKILGRIADVQADNQWHHAEFDLAGHVQTALGRLDSTVAQDLFIGNLNDTDYLQAGFGANHAGVSYYLDNFVLASPSANKTVKLAWHPAEGIQPSGYAIALDDQPLSLPAETISTEHAEAAVEASGPGPWFAHVRPRLAEDQWGPVASYPIWIDDQGPRLVGSDPPEGELDDQPIEIDFAEPGGAGLDLGSLKLLINEQEYDWTSPGIRYEPEHERVILDPRLLGLSLEDEGELSVTIQSLQDRAGNRLQQPVALSWTVKRTADNRPPLLTSLVIGDGYLCDCDFEHDLGLFTAYGGKESALLSRDDSTAASGRSSLKVYNPTEAGRFGLYIRKGPFDAGKYRLISFDYKVPERLRVDFAVFVNGDWKGIKFTDVNNDLGLIGEVPGVQADNKWHHAEFNLYDMLRRDNPAADSYVVSQFILADWGWLGNRRGQTYHLDNFAIIPVRSDRPTLAALWQALDISGIRGAAWHLDSSPTGDPPHKVMSDSNPVQLVNTTDFDGWLHLSVQDKTGRWSESRHQRLLIDSRPPRAARISPPADARLAESVVKIALSDDGTAGIDPSSIVLSVGGQDYRVDNRALTCNPQENVLVWDGGQVRPEPVVFPDGQPVKVTLKQAADFAGNTLAEPLQWNWIMDYAQDHRPPVATMWCQSHPTFMSNTFEQGLGRVKGANTLTEIDESVAATGQGSLKLTKPEGGRLRATICDQSYPAEKFPVISFDYKIPAQTKVALLVQTQDGLWRGFALTGKPDNMVGAVPNIVADDQWHQASIDITRALRQQRRRAGLVVEQVVLSERNRGANAAGAVAHFDNFIIGRMGAGPAVFTWAATDATGIAGYSYLLDQAPGTIPDTSSQGPQTAHEFTGLQAGVWFLHLRARDGAGNWGPPAHYALISGGE